MSEPQPATPTTLADLIDKESHRVARLVFELATFGPRVIPRVQGLIFARMVDAGDIFQLAVETLSTEPHDTPTP